MKRILWCFLIVALTACASDAPAATQLPPRPTQAAIESTPESQPAPADPPPTQTTTGGIVIAPSQEDGGVWAVDPQANRLYQLADATEPQHLLPWTLSPDGQMMAVVVYTGPTPKIAQLTMAELWLVNTDESNPHRILNLLPEGGLASTGDMLRDNDVISGLAYQQTLIWTSANEIVVESYHEGQPDLYAVAADTGAARRLTNTPDIEFNLNLAPSGRTLAYASVSTFGTGGGFGNPQIWVQELNGEPRTALDSETVDTFDGVSLHGWANDQLILSGFSQLDVGHTLLIVKPDGAIESPEIPDGTLAVSPGPDKTFISFSEVVGGSDRTFTWNGTELFQIAETGFPHLVVSPDGQRVYGCSEYAGNRLERQILHIDRGTIQLDDGLCGDAAWSPDGQWLAVGSVIEANQEGFIINAQGETINTLSFGSIPAGWLGGNLLYFIPEGDGWQLYQLTPGSQGNGTPIGQPLPVKPHQPTLINR